MSSAAVPLLRHHLQLFNPEAMKTAATTKAAPERRREGKQRKARIVYNDCAFPAKEGGKAAFLAGQ